MFRVSLGPDEFNELLLSHHPNMKCFDEDVLVIKGHRICLGCLTTWPLAIIVFCIFLPIYQNGIYFALIFFVISQFRKLFKKKKIQIFFRLFSGLAVGFGLGGLIWAVNNNQFFLIILLLIGVILNEILRVNKFIKKMKLNCAD
jgi:fatty acid desaturase